MPLLSTGSVVEAVQYRLGEIQIDVYDVRVLDDGLAEGPETPFLRPHR